MLTFFNSMRQMTVVEAYAGGKKIDPPHKLESPMLRSLLIEGVALNTNGSVYAPEVRGKKKCKFI